VIAFGLRPLGMGEILDRAIALCIRRFGLIFCILAVYSIPAAIVRHVFPFDVFAWLLAFSKHVAFPEATLTGFVSAFILWLAGTLATTAMTIAVADAYRGELIRFALVYRRALSRLTPQIVTSLVFVCIIAILLAGSSAIYGFISSKFLFVFVETPTLIYVFAGVFWAVVGTVIGMIFTTGLMAYVSIAVETTSPPAAIRRSFGRVINAPILWRSLLFMVIYYTVWFGGSAALGYGAGYLDGALRSHIFVPVAVTLGVLFFQQSTTCFAVVYFYDVRLRREGYDLLPRVPVTA
jgi:hypothetical protein